jgi:UDP-N-acetylmuramate dehydrogenase
LATSQSTRRRELRFRVHPTGDSAGRLIDSLGLKSFRVGTAFVSEKHANFIQADPDGRAADVWQLITAVRARVHAETGVVLTPEVRTAGFDATLPELKSIGPSGRPADQDHS